MGAPSLSFHHPFAFWLGCIAISAGVFSHVPMFIHAAPMGYHMAGMPMSAVMIAGMALIPLGLFLSGYGLLPRSGPARLEDRQGLHFHIADGAALNREHWKLVLVLLAAVVVDIMKPATLGFAMPGMTVEYAIPSRTAGTLALVALIGTMAGSLLWGMLADLLGRRAAILLSALMFIGTSICGAMPSFDWNLVMCFLMGMSAGGLLPISFTLMAETIPSRHRGWLLVALGGVGTTGGYLVAAGAAAVLEPLFNWRILWMLGLPTGLLIIFMNHFIPESPRFLARMGRKREARQVLSRFSSHDHHGPDDLGEEGLPESGLASLLAPPYKGITLGLMGAGLAWGLVNFGFLLWLPTNLQELGQAEQVNGLIARSAVLALPGTALVIWLYHHWNTVHALVLFLCCTAASLLLFGALRWLAIDSLSLLSLATSLLLVSSSGVIAMLIPYAAEIYPGHLRGTGSGAVAAFSKAGGVLGTALGVLGLLDNMILSSVAIAFALAISALLLLRSGIDTRGLRLEDIHAALVNGTGSMKSS